MLTTASKKRSFNEIIETQSIGSASKKRKLNNDPPTDADVNSFLNDASSDDDDDNDSDGSSNNNNINNNKNNNDDLPLPSSSFESLNLSQNTLLGLYSFGFESMTRIQSLSIPHLLSGKNLVGSARTGSGKTISFLVPVIEHIIGLPDGWNYMEKGVNSLIISPTRELSLQIFNVLRKLAKYHQVLSCGLLIGGNPRHSDIVNITRGMIICVSTPGRLLDHLIRTKLFNCNNLDILVLDEADRILDEGYLNEIKQIFKYLPSKKRQTILFSATQTSSTKDLIRLSFSSAPVFVSDGSCINYDNLTTTSRITPTRSCLTQGYILVESSLKFLLLFSFLKKHYKKSKIIIFFSTVFVTKYFVNLLNYIDINCYGLYGAMSQSERTKTFNAFVDNTIGILLATNVAARGLDIPGVDWIIQYDPANDIKNYIHRVGRTNRGIKEKNGKALLFLIPQEIKYLNILKKYNINVIQYDCPSKKKIANIQLQLERITSTVYNLHVLAHKAYQAYIREYGLRNNKIFNVLSLKICNIAKSFGLNSPPKMTVQVKKGNKYKTITMRLQTNKWANKEFDNYDFMCDNDD